MFDAILKKKNYRRKPQTKKVCTTFNLLVSPSFADLPSKLPLPDCFLDIASLHLCPRRIRAFRIPLSDSSICFLALSPYPPRSGDQATLRF